MPGIIFHEHYDAWDGKPAPALASAEFEPPSYELISKFHKTESLVLTMMNKRFDWMGTDERRHLYYTMLSYWNGVVKKFNPDAVIFSTAPHTVYDYILYEIARSENIKTVMFWNMSPIDGRLFFYEDFREGSGLLSKITRKNMSYNFSVSDLSEETRKFYETGTLIGVDALPLYLKEDHERFAFLNRMILKTKAILATIKRGEFVEQTARRAANFFKENIRDEHIRAQFIPDYSQKFVYVPLHYQPECTTSPLGDIFVDQILMIKILSASLPVGWKIYAKEHPFQWYQRGLNFAGSRYRGYYDKISGIKNVRLVPLETDNYELINRAQAVATVGGTAGIEALLRQKPVIVFGYPWYRSCPHVFKADGVESCSKALQKIADGFSVNNQSIINFLKNLDESTIRGYVDEYGQRFVRLSAEENSANISRAILEIITEK
ncbi:MAG: hypothetical protein HYY55_00090 [Candidatus Niyogibacteria bacterium]|nr:MAG: hypothetical protein HYY55_00090 [Candidatus Niyogibacteria bacterium]